MPKKIITILLAAALAPVAIFAINGEDSLTDSCLVPVFHTDFAFPPEGGKIIQIGEQMFFVHDYLPECANAGSRERVVSEPNNAISRNTQAVPRNSNLVSPRTGNSGIGQGLVEFLIGSGCLTPVFHTDFAFPPEGGKIVRMGDDLFFVHDYLAGCENAGNGGVVIKSSGEQQVTVPPPAGFGGGIVEFLVGNPCLVPVYHTNFAFPPEGGKIIERNGQLFFVKTYLRGCENI